LGILKYINNETINRRLQTTGKNMNMSLKEQTMLEMTVFGFVLFFKVSYPVEIIDRLSN